MFYYIDGIVTELEPNLAVLDCGGVGYALNISNNTAAALKLKAKAKLYVAEAIGETNFDLYGFADKSEKRCFNMLTSVSGIGPRAALSIMSYNTPEGLALAVMNGDEKALTVAPGIGKRIAQRIILELKDKIAKELGDVEYVPIAASAAVGGAGDGHVSDALAALTVLGYSNAEVAPILKKLDVSGMSAEEIIKAVLKQMVK